MEKLNIVIEGSEKILDADIKISKGIYAVTESKLVKRNIEKLKIKFDESLADNILQHRRSKIGNWSFLTSKAVNQYLQYIFMPSASREDFDSFLKQFNDDSTMRQMLIDTYNMSRLTVSNLEILSGLKKNRN
jgi:hypothetical protein